MNPEEKKIYIAFSFIAVLLLLFVGIFFYYILKQQKRYNLLQKQKLDAEIETSEAERFQIATELHNDVGPLLSGIKMRLQLIETTDESVRQETLTALDQTILQLRTISNRLAPLSILKFHWVDALRQYIEIYHQQSGMKIELAEFERVSIQEEKHLVLYRILQEIILNAVKHAQAEVLKIEVSRDGDQLLIRTSDNGVGFDTNNIDLYKSDGLGLLSIESRVQHIKGTLSLLTALGKGTKYNIRIPLA